MKKLLIAALVFVLLATPASALSPPPSISIRGDEELLEMRKMAEAEEEVLLNYLNRFSFIGVGLKSREDLISFLELIDSLPILYLPEMRFRDIWYVPSYNNDFDISFESENGESFRFGIPSKERRAIVDFFEIEVTLIYECQDKRMKIYTCLERWFPSERGTYHFSMEIDGFIVHFTRFPRDNERSIDIFLKEIHENMIITSFKDEPWRTTLNTSDALLILQATAGLIELTHAQVVKFGIGGAPTTADALKILRIIAGL
jgi:hypothetical protein